MTSEEFRADYHLLDRISSGAVETYHAQAVTGAMLMIHFLHGEPHENTALLARLEQLEPTRRARVLRTVQVDDVPAVITRFILDFTHLHDWIRDGLPGGSEVAAEPAPTTTDAATEPPDLQASSAPLPAAPSPAEEPRTTLPFEPDAAVPEDADKPGEFTLLFRAPAPAPPAPAPAAPERAAPEPPAPAPPVTDPGSEAGEFTRMFKAPVSRGPVAEGDAAPRVAPASSPEAGPKPVQPITPAATAGASTSPPAKPEAPGEFTQMFGAAPRPDDLGPAPALPPDGPASDPRPGPLPIESSETPPAAAVDIPDAALGPDRGAKPPAPSPPPARSLQYPSPTAGPVLPPWPASAESAPLFGSEPPVPPAGAAEPGEYTRMFGAPVLPADAPAAQKPFDPPASPPALDVGSVSYRDRLAGPTPAHAPPGPIPPGTGPMTPGSPFGSPPAPPTGPSEFTRVISALPQPPAPPTAAPPPAQRPAAATRSSRGLIIGLAVVVVLAIAFVVVVLLTG